MRSEHEAEFREYVGAKLASMRYFAYLSCGDWHRAEDAVQVAFEKLYVAWHRARKATSVDAYTRRVVVNSLLNERRRAWFRRERSSAEPPETAALSTAEPHEDRDVLLRALGHLPMRQRTTVVLRFWEDQSVDETARLMGCSVSTVKSQTSRALEALRGLLGPHTHTPVQGAQQ